MGSRSEDTPLGGTGILEEWSTLDVDRGGREPRDGGVRRGVAGQRLGGNEWGGELRQEKEKGRRCNSVGRMLA